MLVEVVLWMSRCRWGGSKGPGFYAHLGEHHIHSGPGSRWWWWCGVCSAPLYLFLHAALVQKLETGKGELVRANHQSLSLSLSLSLALCLCLSFSLHRSVSGALYMQLRLRQAGVAPRREDSLLSQPGISYSVRTMPMSPAPTARLGL